MQKCGDEIGFYAHPTINSVALEDTLKGSAVAHGGNPQDRTASPLRITVGC